MKIRRISTLGFRGLPDRAFDFIDTRTGSPNDTVIVTGPSGAGKTSFLDALIAAKEDVGPYGGKESAAFYVEKGGDAAKVRAEWHLSADEVARVGATSGEFVTESVFGAPLTANHDKLLASVLYEYDLDPAVGKVEYFHAARRLPLRTAGLAGASAAIDRTRRLKRDNDKYAWLPQYLIDLAVGLVDMSGQGLAGSEILNRSLGIIGLKKGFRGVGKTPDGTLEPRFYDRAGALYALGELSEGERQLLLFAVAFMRCGIHHSIVLIDTPELHLTSQEAALLLPALQRLGEDNQFFVATGSKDVVASLPNATLVRLDSPEQRVS
jgi:hypothetical protein